MKKYLLFAAFIFSQICFAQELSIEEQLKLLGADDFFVSDVSPQRDTNAAKTSQEDENAQNSDSLSIFDGDSVSAGNVPAESGGRRQPMSSSSAMMPGGGQGRPAATIVDTTISNCREIDGKEICDTTFSIVSATSAEKISIFDTASVAEERTIDFHRNLSQYRSPQKAFLYSLLLPGFGQAYNKNYWRTGLYAAVEIGMITGAIYFRKDATKIRKEAENFAETHFDTTKLSNFYKTLTDFGYDKYTTDIIAEGFTIGDVIFGGGGIFSDEYEVFVTPETTDTTYILDPNGYAYKEYMKQFSEDFYGNIRTSYATQGWSDANFNAYDIDTTFDNPPYVIINGQRGFGISSNQRHFISLMDESAKQGRRGSAFVVGIFVNHIASAMDAFLSTIIHNRKLLRDEKGESPTKTDEILSKISIESDMYLDKNGEITSKLGFVWRF
jgi:hypothetical protein